MSPNSIVADLRFEAMKLEVMINCIAYLKVARSPMIAGAFNA